MKRYLCERCGTGSLAPGRMAPDDIRRFCLDCSKATGKLVPLICPSRERAKQRTQQRAAEKRKQERERETREKFTLPDGTDIRPVFKRIQRLNVWKRETRGVQEAVGKMRLVGMPNNVARFPTERDYALNCMYQMAQVAPHYIPYRLYVGPSSKAYASISQSLLRAAACEYWQLDEDALVQFRRAVVRLEHGANADNVPIDWLPILKSYLAGKLDQGEDDDTA